MPNADEEGAPSIAVQGHPGGGFVLRVGEAAFVSRIPVFEQAGSYGNGPAWGELIDFIVATDPRMADYEMDPEGLAWSPTREPLERLRSILLEVTADADHLRPVVLAARAAGFGHGEL